MHLRSLYTTYEFFCVFLHVSNSYRHAYPGQTNESEDSVGIMNLRLMAPRFMGLPRQTFLDDRLSTETKTCGSFKNFRNKYGELYNSMRPFLIRLSQVYKPGVDPILSYVSLIPLVMEPNERGFIFENIKHLKQKFELVQWSLKAVMNNAIKYVQENETGWFKNTSKTVNNYLSNVTSASSGKLCDDSEVKPISCGISCTNYGVSTDMEFETLWKVHDLANFLIYGKLPPKQSRNAYSYDPLDY